MHAHVLLNVKFGPSADDLRKAYLKNDGEDEEIEKAREEVTAFTQMMGVTAWHPQRNVAHWPPPEGLARERPRENVLRQRFTDVSTDEEYWERYEKLLNRTMLHTCRVGYCLKPPNNNMRRQEDQRAKCRFGFEKAYHGFQPIWDVNGSSLLGHKWMEGYDHAEIGLTSDGKMTDLYLMRNHPRMVSHIPELLSIWQANIEGRPVRSYEQVIRYLLKYMMKEEPNSKPFDAMMRASVEEVDEADPVRKVFTRTLIKSMGNHDLSKQEVMHILNGIPFVTFPRSFVYANVMGTRCIEEDLQAPGEDPNRQVRVKKNIADQYWGRDSDPRYLKACKDYEAGGSSGEEKHPRDVSLYEYASKYRADWIKSNEVKVPHFTPNFSRIPRRLGNKNRYMMFLKSMLLIHVPGAKFEDIELLSLEDLEEECRLFSQTQVCPKLVREEFNESQKEDLKKKKKKPGREDEEDYDLSDDEPLENPRGSQEDLVIEPEVQDFQYEQAEPWERLCGLIDFGDVEAAVLGEDGECLYDHPRFKEGVNAIDWSADARRLGITTPEHFRQLESWLHDTTQTYPLHRNLAASGGLPTDLNQDQFRAFAIVGNHLKQANKRGIANVPQLLLNISGPAGSGKTFWLNTLRRWAQGNFNQDQDFILAAAPTGAAAFLIGGSTLHSLLYLPKLEGGRKMPPLDASRLKSLQDKFRSVAVLIIDEKSMIGQKMFYMISERLKEARPKTQDQPFGGVSIVILGDWRQLPPVFDKALFHNSGGKWVIGYNLYRCFKNTVIFTKVQRQEGEGQKDFRAQLERLGNGEFTSKDWEKWSQRSLKRLPPQERLTFEQTATKACARKQDMQSYNVQRIEALKQPIAPLPAQNDCHEARLQGEKETGLPDSLLLCKGAKIRLSSNLWTAAGLVNGAVGFVQAIIYANGEKPPETLPKAIICTFEGYIGPSFLSSIPKAVPIVPAGRTFYVKGKTCSRKQLPVIPSYALSIHKLQGSTEDKIILDPGPKEFAAGLLFVGATRTRAFEDLALDPMPNFHRFDMVNKKQEIKLRKGEEARMAKLAAETIKKFKTVIANCTEFFRKGSSSVSLPKPPAPPRPNHPAPPKPAPSGPAPPRPAPPRPAPPRPAPPRPAPPRPYPPAPSMPAATVGPQAPTIDGPARTSVFSRTLRRLRPGSSSTVTAGMAQAQKILERRSLDQQFFCKTDTKGDGNCFFHAIADQLTNQDIRDSVAPLARNIPGDHRLIRQRVVDFARSQSDMLLQRDSLLNYLQDEEDEDRRNNPPGRDFLTIWQDYLKGMKKPGTYATELIVLVAAIYFGKDIMVIKDDYVHTVEGSPQPHDPHPMVIVNMGDDHFQSVHPQD